MISLAVLHTFKRIEVHAFMQTGMHECMHAFTCLGPPAEVPGEEEGGRHVGVKWDIHWGGDIHENTSHHCNNSSGHHNNK